jgi:transcription initiation factor IIE alpha subunit
MDRRKNKVNIKVTLSEDCLNKLYQLAAIHYRTRNAELESIIENYYLEIERKMEREQVKRSEK